MDDKSEGENKSDRMRSSIQRAFFSPDPKTLEELKDAANAYLDDDRSRLKTYLQDFGEKMGRLRDKLQSGLEAFCLGKLKRMPDKNASLNNDKNVSELSDEQVKEVATKFAALLTDWIVMDRDESRFYELLEILDDDQIKRAVHVVRSVNVGERANVGAIFTKVSTEFDASLGKIPKAKAIVQAALSNLVVAPKASSSTPGDEDDGGKMNIVTAFQVLASSLLFQILISSLVFNSWGKTMTRVPPLCSPWQPRPPRDFTRRRRITGQNRKLIIFFPFSPIPRRTRQTSETP